MLRTSAVSQMFTEYAKGLFLMGYAHSYKKYQSSVGYMLRMGFIHKTNASRIAKRLTLNFAEKSLLRKLDKIYNRVPVTVTKKDVDAALLSIDDVDTVRRTSSAILTTCILSGCCKETIDDMSVVSLINDGKSSNAQVKMIFLKGVRLEPVSDSSFVKRLYTGAKSDTMSRNDLTLMLIDTVNLRLLPDNSTGVNITKASAIDLIANTTTSNVLLKENIDRTFDQFIFDLVDERNKIFFPAIEAVVDEADEAAPAPDEEPDTGDENADTGDNTGEDNQADPSPEGEDNQDETTEELKSFFKSGLELDEKSTLDDLMYKIAVARHIQSLLDDDTIEDGRVASLLKLWKLKFLFIVSAENTRKFLRLIKIKVK